MRPLNPLIIMKALFYDIRQRKQAIAGLHAANAEQEAALDAHVKAHGLKAELAELVALDAPPVVSTRVEEPTVRVRVREGFSTEWNRIPYYGPTGAGLDLPKGLVRAAPQLFEHVPDGTPLHTPALVAPLPR